MMDRLSWCANEAMARGMTYGKYMTIYGGAPQPKQKDEGDTVCRFCGKKFYRKLSGRKYYCSFDCYEQWSRESARLRAREKRGWKAAI